MQKRRFKKVCYVLKIAVELFIGKVSIMITVNKRENGTSRVQFTSDGDCLVEQDHAKELDINRMRQQHGLPAIPLRGIKGLKYGDFTNFKSFHDCMTRIVKAKEDFMKQPAKIRAKFNNDPGKLVEFLSKPENLKEAVELNLIDEQDIVHTEDTEEQETPPEEVETEVETPTTQKNT